jgi:hypothetical protein
LGKASFVAAPDKKCLGDERLVAGLVSNLAVNNLFYLIILISKKYYPTFYPTLFWRGSVNNPAIDFSCHSNTPRNSVKNYHYDNS